MDIHKILQQAIDGKVRLLPEDVERDLLSRYGIKAPPGKRVKSFDEIDRTAGELGYPLLVKALVPDLIHKSDRGAVKLGVHNNQVLRKMIEDLWNLFPGVPLLGEKMIGSGVELISGLTLNDNFGRCLMIGTGGLFTDSRDANRWRTANARNSQSANAKT